MSVQSTISLTREEAERRYVALRLAKQRIEAEREFKHLAAALSDKFLEDAIERLNDEIAGGEGLWNFLIEEKVDG